MVRMIMGDVEALDRFLECLRVTHHLSGIRQHVLRVNDYQLCLQFDDVRVDAPSIVGSGECMNLQVPGFSYGHCAAHFHLPRVSVVRIQLGQTKNEFNISTSEMNVSRRRIFSPSRWHTVVRCSSKIRPSRLPVLCKCRATSRNPKTTYSISIFTPYVWRISERLRIASTPCASPDMGLLPGKLQTMSSAMIAWRALLLRELSAAMKS